MIGAMTRKLPHCRGCDQIGHYTYQCWRLKKEPIKTISKLKMSGKYSKKWLATRKEWFSLNPPNPFGYYACYLCGRWFTPKEITLDHVLPRGSHPELRYELTNLKPCCWECNQKKGSRHD
jgi:5-methylcytosine-specific restriction endonuclease McrA